MEDTIQGAKQEVNEDLKLLPDIPKDHFVSEEQRDGPIFVPQLYIQRYFYVQQELQKHQVRSVVDFGSAECKISRFLARVSSLEKIALVDIDGALLAHNKHTIQPQVSDYIKARSKGLKIKIYEGSVTELDEAVCGYEAVSLVEIIEHLYPDILEAACQMIFSGLKPKVIIVTTPNADYNQLFPNFTGFRHWDHKFEWTRNEFQQWATDLTQKYPYEVTFSGVGDPPQGSEHLGFCSQSAVFTRNTSGNSSPDSETFPVTSTYKCISESSYPCRPGTDLSETDSLLLEVDYLIRNIDGCSDWDTEYEEDIKCLVPLSYFLKFEQFKNKFNIDQLRTFLQNHGYRISTDGQSVVVPEDSVSDISEDDLYSCDQLDHVSSVVNTDHNDSGVLVEQGDCMTDLDCEDWG